MRDGAHQPTESASAASMLTAIGSQIRSSRKERGMTMGQLSEAAGLSTGLLSELERGLANPSFTTLVQVAHGLGVPVGRLLYVPDHQKSPVVRKGERRKLDGHGLSGEDGGHYELMTPDLSGALEVTWVETPPGYDTSATPYRHHGEEFGVVLTGRKDVYVDGTRYRLEPGDSVRYSSSVPHWYVNPGDENCTAIWVITPPTW